MLNFFSISIFSQILNINEFKTFDSILISNNHKIDTIIIWGKYQAYIRYPLFKRNFINSTLKKSNLRTAIQFKIFNTETEVYYPLFNDKKLINYNQEDLIKLKLYLYHDLKDKEGKKICIVEKVL